MADAWSQARRERRAVEVTARAGRQGRGPRRGRPRRRRIGPLRAGRGRRDGPRSSPMPWPATPTPPASLRHRARPDRCRRRPPGDRAALLGPAGRWRDAAASQHGRPAATVPAWTTPSSSWAASTRHDRTTPLVAMGYVNQVLGGRDGATVLRRLGEAGVSGFILADLTPDEGAELEAEAAALRHRHRLPRGADHARSERRALRGGAHQGFLYAVSLAGVTGARKRLPPGVAPLRARRPRGEPGARGRRLRRLQAGARSPAGRVADGIIVASALVDALGPDGRDIDRMAALVRSLAAATARA